jgi:hypothetical protein
MVFALIIPVYALLMQSNDPHIPFYVEVSEGKLNTCLNIIQGVLYA